jgi:hypothetical protein
MFFAIAADAVFINSFKLFRGKTSRFN